MRQKLVIALSTGCLVLAAGIASAQHHGHGDHKGHAPASADTRELVRFPPALAEHTLANMRDHMLALQEITEALARGHYDQAAKVAERRLGMSALGAHGAHEVSKFMPKGMQAAGTAMHRAASRFAIEAQNSSATGDVRPALAVLGEVMSACVGCHAGYRLK